MNAEDFEKALVGEPPRAAAASFFVKLKQASNAKENAVIATACKLASAEEVAKAKREEPKGIPGGGTRGMSMTGKLGEKTAQPMSAEEQMAFADQVSQAQ